MKHSLQGLKFYRFIDGKETPEIIRLRSVNDSKKHYNFIDYSKDPDAKLTIITEEELEEGGWIKLNPDGIIAFSVVDAKTNEGDETEDVTIRFHRIDRSEQGIRIDPMPFAICRQSVIDIFAMIQQNKYIAGMSISQATCPPEVRYEGCCAYTKMKKNVNVAYYIGDTMDAILECIDRTPFNRALDGIKYRSKMKNSVQGYVEDIGDLARDNYFMLDVHTGMHVAEFPLFKSFDFSDSNVNKAITDYILSNKQEVPTKFYPQPYTKYIDLNEIEKPYILISPDSRKVSGRDGQIILVAYDISSTISFKDYINKGRSAKRAKREIMAQLGWK